MKNNYALLNTFALDPKKVKVQLIQRDKLVSRMALDLGLGQPTVSKYINGQGRNPKIQQAIADYLGVPLDDLLDKGGRYDAECSA